MYANPSQNFTKSMPCKTWASPPSSSFLPPSTPSIFNCGTTTTWEKSTSKDYEGNAFLEYLPMLEGMLCGVPVITSNTSSMPEVGGDAALFIDPFRPEEITSAMKRILGDSGLRADLVRKGLINAGRFSWKTMAEKMLEIYKETYNNL